MKKFILKKMKNRSCPLIFLYSRFKITDFLKKLIIFLSLLTIFGTIIYYFYALNFLGIIISLFLTIITFLQYKKYLKTLTNSDNTQLDTAPKNNTTITISTKAKIIKNSLLFVYFLLLFLLFLILQQKQSDAAIISPWELIPSSFFFLYFLSVLVLLILGLYFNIKRINLLLSLHYFLSISIATIVYKIFYGFDPFIHQASLEIINKIGYIKPKTPYYLGYYSLLSHLHRFFSISLNFLNKYLLIILASIFLPISLSALITKMTNKINTSLSYKHSKLISFIGVFFLLSLSYPLFLINTPQNLSYLFLILTLIFALKNELLTALITALATLAIHPLSGISLIIYIVLLFLIKLIFQSNLTNVRKRYLHYIVNILTFLTSALSVPLILYKINAVNFKQIWQTLIKVSLNLEQIFNSAGQENWWLNLSYFLYFNRFLIILLLIILGIIIARKYWKQALYKKVERFNFLALILIACSLLLAAFLSSLVTFKEIINYEQSNYALRLFIIAIIFLSPFLIFFQQKIVTLIINKKPALQIIYLFLFALLIPSLLYLSYPRFDNYYNSRGYSTSITDIEAVNWIEENSQEPYLVLANQQVSAAAINELGFKHYFKTDQGDVFFYPIPTGGPLYNYYLKMVYEGPERKHISEAMKWLGVKQAYFVINKYWHASETIIASAKLNADSWLSLGVDDIYIFSYYQD